MTSTFQIFSKAPAAVSVAWILTNCFFNSSQIVSAQIFVMLLAFHKYKKK